MSPRLSDVLARQGRSQAQRSGMTHSPTVPPVENEEDSERGAGSSRWPGGLWLVGIHGGAGVSSLSAAGVGRDSARRWPTSPAPGSGYSDPLSGPTVSLPVVDRTRSGSQGFPPGGVLLVTRESATGLSTATKAAASVQRGNVPDWLEVLGLVVVAAGPARPPKLVRERLDLVAGWMPKVWRIPWVPELLAIDLEHIRYCAPFKAAVPKSLYALQDLGRK
jgi:hypothetical protein